MANVLPIVFAAGAAALLLGKKKKKKAPVGEEPDGAPGAGMGDPGFFTIGATLAEQAEPELLLAARALPPADKADPVKTGNAAAKEHEEDEQQNPPQDTKCKLGTVSSDKKYICWGNPGQRGESWKLRLRRVPKYKTARNAAAAVALTGGFAGSPAMLHPRTAFLIYCWVNRNRKGIYRCTKRWKRGRKSCRSWKRY